MSSLEHFVEYEKVYEYVSIHMSVVVLKHPGVAQGKVASMVNIVKEKQDHWTYLTTQTNPCSARLSMFGVGIVEGPGVL